MMFFDLDPRFWLASLGAALVRLATSERRSLLQSVVLVGTAVFAAWAFTDGVLDLLKLPDEIYRTPVTALVALTGENVMRWAMRMSEDPARLLDFIRSWLGMKK